MNSNRPSPTPQPRQAQRYCIRIQGHLDASWGEWFDGLAPVPEENGDTLLVGPLHGVLARVRDLGIPLLSVHRVEADAEGGSGASGHQITEDYDESIRSRILRKNWKGTKEMLRAATLESEVRAWLSDRLEDWEGPVDLDLLSAAADQVFKVCDGAAAQVQTWTQEEVAKADRSCYSGHETSHLREGPVTPIYGDSWD